MFKNIFILFILAACFFNTPVVFAGNLKQGMDYYYSGKYSRAETFFRKAVNTNSSDYSAKYMLAASLVNLQKYNEAKDLYKNIIRFSNNSKLITLSQKGLNNLGENYVISSGNSIKNSPASAVINVDTVGSVIIVENVMLNDRLKAGFVLDTGATYTTISRQIASKLNISTKGSKTIKVMTGSGYISAPLVRLDKIELKGMVVRNVDVIITDLPVHGSGNDEQVAGLLGLSFLQNFKITVDRAGGKITLEKN